MLIMNTIYGAALAFSANNNHHPVDIIPEVSSLSLRLRNAPGYATVCGSYLLSLKD
jgi:hypothetical protein